MEPSWNKINDSICPIIYPLTTNITTRFVPALVTSRMQCDMRSIEVWGWQDTFCKLFLVWYSMFVFAYKTFCSLLWYKDKHSE